MSVNSRGHNLDTRFDHLFCEIKHPPGLENPVGEIIFFPTIRPLHEEPESPLP